MKNLCLKALARSISSIFAFFQTYIAIQID
jgi:hypothetical protein